MILHNLKQIFRSLFKYKSFTIINLAGLSIGIAAAILIFLIADYEKKFDRFHEHGQDIYRVVTRGIKEEKPHFEATVPCPTGKYLRNENSGILATQIHFSDNEAIQIDHQPPFEEKNVLFADSMFFKVFDFTGVKRMNTAVDLDKILAAPGKAMITERAASKYFGRTNPIGQVLKIATTVQVEIAAVIPDIPITTHLPFNLLISYPSLTRDFFGGLDPDNWGFRSNGYCYVRTTAGTNNAYLTATLNAINNKYSTTEDDKKDTYSLQPLYQIHFDPTFDTTNPSYTVTTKYIGMLLLLGMFILLIACINYINLSTSLAFSKSKEVGIRKAIGATKRQLFFFYISETFLLTTAAMVIGFIIAFGSIPVINKLLEKTLSAGQMVQFPFILSTLGTLVIISLLSGIYPALVLAGFNPIESLKNKISLPGKGASLLRKGLVVFQFTISVALIICTIVIARQMHYFNSQSLGFNKESVVEISLPSSDSAKRAQLQALLQNQTGIQRFSFCLGAPISDNGVNTSLNLPGKSSTSDYSIKILASDLNYLETYDIREQAGRWFFKSEENQLGKAIVVNEKLVSLLGFRTASEAIGKKLPIGINKFQPEIIGVVKDFHTSSLHESIGPVGIMPFPYFYYAVAIRLSPGAGRSALTAIESSFRKVYPDYIYTANFIDDQLAKLYKEDRKNYNLFKAFSVISIFICCIGLWGLIAFVVVRKTKEIGVRKVLGASVVSIVNLLSKEFIRLVLIGFVIASPIAWYLMNRWLENFAYRIEIQWWFFGLAALLATTIALLTISFQSIRAALSNPVKNLRSE